MNAKQRNLIYRILPYLILTVIGICFLLPLLWVLVASVDPNAMQSLKMPTRLTGANYGDVITNGENQRAFLIGLFMSLGQAVIVVILGLLAAYPLSRYQMKYKKPFMLTILFMTSLPITAVMVPVYQLFLSLKLYNNIFGVILFYVASSMPYGIWMLKNFMDSVPNDMEAAPWPSLRSLEAGAISSSLTSCCNPRKTFRHRSSCISFSANTAWRITASWRLSPSYMRFRRSFCIFCHSSLCPKGLGCREVQRGKRCVLYLNGQGRVYLPGLCHKT